MTDDIPVTETAEATEAAAPEEILTIYVSKMKRDTTAEALKEACAQFGEVVGGTKRVPRTFGYVDFKDKPAVEAAVAAGVVEVDGEEATIALKDLSKARPPPGVGDGGAIPENYVNTSIIVRDVDEEAKREDISELFSQFGEVAKVEIRRRPYVCYAFVKFGTPEEMQAALAAADSLELNGSKVTIEERRPPRAAVSGREGPVAANSIYVRDFAAETTDEDLMDAFKSHGEVKSLIKRVKSYEDDENGGGTVTRTWAFVEYMSSEAADAAVAADASPELNGVTLTVEKRSSQPVALNRRPRRGGGGRNRGGRRQNGRAPED